MSVADEVTKLLTKENVRRIEVKVRQRDKIEELVSKSKSSDPVVAEIRAVLKKEAV